MADVKVRLEAALDGRYVLERQLGEGGMATVYLADDVRHKRKVALKVLKPALAEVVGPHRFLSEIETTANLHHPHILPLFDSGDAAGFLFYVMPFVEGESLRARLEREEQLPVDDAVRIAVQLAEALSYAHAHGVVHRDIKPDNILLHAGAAIISDFGIALVTEAASEERLTETGLAIGTPHYMSPEQAAGDVRVGPPTDVYALGCVLYEMLVGEPPYQGRTPQAILGRILTGEVPSVSAQRRSVAANVDGAVRRALEKLPADRFSDALAFARALGDPGFRHQSAALIPAARPSWRLSRTVALTGVAALLIVAGLALVRPSQPSVATRMSLVLPDGHRLAEPIGPRVVLSPDGRRFAYVGGSPGEDTRIWVREMDRLTADPVVGTEGARSPTISPDGRRIGFLQGSGARVADLDGGSVTPLVDSLFSDYPATLHWGRDGFVYAAHRGLLRVPQTGGRWEVALPRDTLGRWHMNPELLPNGWGAVFALGQNETRSATVIAVADLRTREVRELTNGVMARYLPTDRLAVVRADGVVEVFPFDQDRLEVIGTPTTLGVSVGIGPWMATDLTLSQTGTLMYTTGAPEPRRQVVWVDRAGFAQPVDPSWTGPYESVALSPDGRRLAVGTGFGPEPQLWIRSLDTGALSRLTLEGSFNRRPVWSPDGTTLTFISQRGGNRDVYRMRVDGASPAELVLDLAQHVDEVDLSTSDDWLVYRAGISGGEGRDVFALRLGGDAVPLAVAASTTFDEMTPSFSPDGRWVAYVSLESGREEVFVRSFPDVSGRRIQVSVAGGRNPVWATDGSELFYIEPSARVLMAAELRRAPDLDVVEVNPLFPASRYLLEVGRTAYDVSPDGEAFLMIRDDDQSRGGELILVQNFSAELAAASGN